MRNTTRGAAIAATAVVAALTLSACGHSAGTATPTGTGSYQGELVSGGTYTIAVASDPGNLDPSRTPSSVARSILGLSYDTLLYQKANGQFVSGVASKWSSTATTATFTLKPGITCSDGSAFTASDAAQNITYIGNPKNASPLFGVFVHQGDTVKADDATRTVTVTSATADGFLLNELAGIYMICKAGLDNHALLAHKTLGTGPWALTSAQSGNQYVFSPRKGYDWGPGGARLGGPGTPAKVEVRVIPSVTTTANLLLNGSVNVGAVSGPDASRLTSLKLPTIDSVDTSGETWFNQAPGHPGADPAVREALTLAIDRAPLGKIATGNNVQSSHGFVTLDPNPCSSDDPVSGNLPSYNLARAEQVLTADGWKVGANGIRTKNGKQLTVAFRYDEQGLDARGAGAEYLATEWQKLGVKVSLKALPEAQLNQLFFSTGAWDVAWADFTFNLPSQMVSFVSGAAPTKGSNFSDIQNPAYNAAAKAATPKVGTSGCGDWTTAQEALVKSYSVMPLYDSVSRTYLRKAQMTAPGGQIWGASLRLRSA